MTCKDCIHYDVCKEKYHHLYESYSILDAKNIENICKSFKDKSKYIELPCKVGDMVYAYSKAVNQIVGYSIEDIHIDNEKTSFFATAFDVYFNDFLDDKEFTSDDIGRTVFLTKAEAEAKLKEMNDNV